MNTKENTDGYQPLRILRLIFGLSGRVSRGLYAAVGFTLMALKYVVEAAVIYLFNQLVFSPVTFLIPSYMLREPYYADGPSWLPWSMVIWSLPFVWIAVTMSVRRAIDAGFNPLFGMLVLVPVVNLFVMLYLTSAPSSSLRFSGAQSDSANPTIAAPDASVHPLDAANTGPPVSKPVRIDDDRRFGESDPAVKESPDTTAAMMAFSAVLGVLVGGLFAVGTTVFSVYTMDNYGGSLFLGMPIVTSAVAGYIFNQPYMRGLGGSILVGLLAVSVGGLGLLLFAFEGVICLVMAMPLILPLGALGGALGWLFAKTIMVQSKWMLGGAMLIVPFLALVERHVKTYEVHLSESCVIVDATKEEVWENVVSFPDIETPPAWYFRMGVASPLRARIIGSGVGAVRHCEFTTGSFVEPITVWDKPNRLAFNVTEQPDPLIELTPYRDIRPPHLQHSFRSVQGEFELIELEDGRTKLIGRTWYTLDMGPRIYWRVWTNEIIHRIHLRVLNHIRENTEQ